MDLIKIPLTIQELLNAKAKWVQKKLKEGNLQLGLIRGQQKQALFDVQASLSSILPWANSWMIKKKDGALFRH